MTARGPHRNYLRAVSTAKNMHTSVALEWFGDAPENGKGVEVRPLSDGGWGFFKSGAQIGAMSGQDVVPLEGSAIPSGAPEPMAAPPRAPRRVTGTRTTAPGSRRVRRGTGPGGAGGA